ncbi:hypothetical protein BV898_19997 [Hypsibius exemplaris]|uniref:Uncharacterized protein n=1 Tax=Hypsibius exemplaris TaxID=2072580 RepID=A0A9X6RQ45_HYPEX|nr:hypothetical protein BV898_19997 [Hypsibius exemplaris]
MNKRGRDSANANASRLRTFDTDSRSGVVTAPAAHFGGGGGGGGEKKSAVTPLYGQEGRSLLSSDAADD